MHPIVEDFAGGLVLLAVVAYLVFWVRTVLMAANSDLDPKFKSFWVLAILVFQFFGPVAWHLVRPDLSDQRSI